MNDQERQVISDIFRRLEQVASQQRDPEAERLIQDKIRQQPYAPYAMAQSLYVQEQALTNLNAQVQQLEAEVEELRRQPQGSGGFLSGLFGGGQRRDERPAGASPWGAPGSALGGQQGYGQQPSYMQPQQAGGPQGGPWGGQQGMMPQRGGSGFLGGALMTAAGVAGGMMLGSALANAFSGAHGTGGQAAAGGLENLGGDAAQSGGASDLSPFGGAQPDQNEDFGGDFGGDVGGDDWN